MGCTPGTVRKASKKPASALPVHQQLTARSYNLCAIGHRISATLFFIIVVVTKPPIHITVNVTHMAQAAPRRRRRGSRA
jgi:hypothetical protein